MSSSLDNEWNLIFKTTTFSGSLFDNCILSLIFMYPHIYTYMSVYNITIYIHICAKEIYICVFYKTQIYMYLVENTYQFSSVPQLCPTLCDPMNRSTPGLAVHHQLPEFTQTHVHRVSDAIQPSHPLSSLSPPAPNPCQHQSLFQWVNSSHEVAKVLEFQL